MLRAPGIAEFLLGLPTPNRPLRSAPPIGREPVDQVLRNTAWLVRELERRCRKRFPAKAILTFPGWFVTPNDRNADAWVLNHTWVPDYIRREKPTMSTDDIHLAVTHLEQYIRTAPSK